MSVLPRSKRTAATTLSYRQIQRARRAVAATRVDRVAALGRPMPRERNPSDGMKQVTTSLVRRAARYIDNDPDLVEWITERLDRDKVKPGRPRELEVRTALICFVIAAIHYKSFNMADLAAMPEGMSWRIRRQLGIDYERDGQVTTVSYDQFLAMFHRIAACFDAWDEALIGDDDEEALRAERADALQTFVDRMCAATTRDMPLWRGDAAIDATLKWSWERPPGSLNGKVARRGVDGDDGRPLSTLEVLGKTDEEDEIEAGAFKTVVPEQVTGRCLAGRNKRKKSWPATWGLGSEWIGNQNKTKSVHGYALHTVVRSEEGAPSVIETFTITPAAGDPAAATMVLLRRLAEQRGNDPAVVAAIEAGEARLLGDIVADPAYTAAGVGAWQLPLKALGATSIARLHRTNQDGPRWHKVGTGKRAQEVVTIAGRPMCECVAQTTLADLRFPKFPYNKVELAIYQAELAKLAAFEWEPNGATRSDGSRQYLSPHGGGVTNPTKVPRSSPDGQPGGCELCVQPSGSPVPDDTGRPRRRCCTAVSKVMPATVTALDIGVMHGSANWYERWNRRNVVEGTYGILKSLAVTNWGRNYHHFVGLARETIVAAFVAVAYNDHQYRGWLAKQALKPGVDESVEEFDPFGPTVPTETRPGSEAVNDRRTAAGARTAIGVNPPGPKGMPFLGPDPNPG